MNTIYLSHKTWGTKLKKKKKKFIIKLENTDFSGEKNWFNTTIFEESDFYRTDV